MKQLIVFILMVLNAPVVFAQDTKTLIHEGDELYRQKKYKEAEEAYRKAAAKKDEKPSSPANVFCPLNAGKY